MTSGNPKLRSELQRITELPKGAGVEWIEDQIRQMEELNKRIPHSVRLHTRCSEDIHDLNCFMFALGIEPHAVSDMRLGPIFPGEKFVQSLLSDGHLIEPDLTRSIQAGKRLATSIESLRAKNPPIFRCRTRPNTSW